MNLNGPVLRRFVTRFNALVLALRDSPRWGGFLRRHFTVVTYTGRRSGRTFSTPVGFRRNGEIVTITVVFAGAKTWWRNFLGEGGPLRLELDGTARGGHAVARRVGGDRVSVVVKLD
ncbi:hypothetical protein N8J89_23525 [Crossiella sp. CA-258035]|uniref:hypothetical protein n=1 Tax=Crossiella sp. CA-258035 TaxID=2981138 RepID=UPI0024BD127A|nr:hypothetical protein [Crossiella sp. CA-258035]WHT16102.1 hypothetical protein N8J89_23525 [Crossiella sp. CA-258035]